MTCFEKYLKDNPILNPYQELYKDNLKAIGCPHQHGYVTQDQCYEYCFNRSNGSNDCFDCWNQEAEETERDKKDYPAYLDRPKKNLEESFCAAGKAAEHAGEVLKEALTIDILPPKGVAIGTIKDSGDRTEFASGAVRDMREGKGRCDLMPLDVVQGWYARMNPDGTVKFQNIPLLHISNFQDDGDTKHLYRVLSNAVGKMFGDEHTMFLEVAKHFEEGAKKYGENNWQKGIPVKCYIDSAVRHYLKYLRGDTDEPHDRAFVWNILCCIWTCKHHPELNEYSMKEGSEE